MTEPDDRREPDDQPAPDDDRPEPVDVRHTTEEERDRAAAVHSLGDEAYVHSDQDDTDLVQGAGGELRRPADEDTGEGTPD